MSDVLRRLMDTGGLPPLAYYFARFVARGCGVDEDGLLARSAALVSLRNLQGDVCVDLAQYAGRPLFGDDDEASRELPRAPALGEWLEALAAATWVGRPGISAPLILDNHRLYLGKYWQYEQTVAEALRERLESVAALDAARLADGLRRLFRDAQDGATDWQKVAAAIAVSRRFAVISGGPGTGKTTTVVKVLALLLEQDPRLHIALAAPTGKAAARLTEAIRGGKGCVDAAAGVLAGIPEEASTLHRLLGAGFGSGFRHNRDNPLVLDCLVVDEASMIDLPLMARLLEALPAQTRLILLGDRDQLASVEAGNVLGDITGHGQEIRYSRPQIDFLEALGVAPGGVLPRASQSPRVADAVGLLRVSYRFAADSGISELARRVNAGEGEAALRLFGDDRYRDIAWLDAREGGLNPACMDWAVDRYARYLQEDDVAAALRSFEQTRVLAALQGGAFGVEEINRRIAERLQARGLIQGGEEYHGKPVMVTTNDYEVGLFNGDIGLLWRAADDTLRAWFAFTANEPRSVSIRQLPEHVCAYALTVHKSQGSEFDEVLLVLPATESRVLTRELVYTGVTRARRRVTIQGERQTFLQGCQHRVLRASALSEKLGWGREQRKHHQATLNNPEQIPIFRGSHALGGMDACRVRLPPLLENPDFIQAECFLDLFGMGLRFFCRRKAGELYAPEHPAFHLGLVLLHGDAAVACAGREPSRHRLVRVGQQIDHPRALLAAPLRKNRVGCEGGGNRDCWFSFACLDRCLLHGILRRRGVTRCPADHGHRLRLDGCGRRRGCFRKRSPHSAGGFRRFGRDIGRRPRNACRGRLGRDVHFRDCRRPFLCCPGRDGSLPLLRGDRGEFGVETGKCLGQRPYARIQ